MAPKRGSKCTVRLANKEDGVTILLDEINVKKEEDIRKIQTKLKNKLQLSEEPTILYNGRKGPAFKHCFHIFLIRLELFVMENILVIQL